MSTRTDIVVGIDGSATSTAAAIWAATVAEAVGARLVLAHALPVSGEIYSPISVIRPQYPADAVAEGEAVVRAASAQITAQFPQLTVAVDTAPGPAWSHLIDASDNAGLIVTGSTGSGALRTRLLGSTALRVANRAPSPVVVWQGLIDSPGPDERPVVVGVDGSTSSEKAVEHAFRFADRFRTPLVAVHSWEKTQSLREGGMGLQVDWDAVAQEEAALLSENLAGTAERYPDVSVSRISEPGAAAAVILEHADDAQLIVVGSHGHSAVAGALLGSTSQNLLHHALGPVMICRS
ncbi:nucleotide-binding universal stress UspA family protein [Rhodococcus sp. 27YEA15]|uniref:universal stress protein n=1 Tax=Rhodococcus sp. 27YEA15 TaxID=3156259 RepID=UPI003C7BC001